MRKRSSIITVLAACLALGPTGCGVLRPPRLPKRVVRPGVSVTAVRLIATGPRAARYDIDVSLYNANDFPLPMTFARYELEIGGHRYKTDLIPKATIPALGRVTVTLPAVLVGDDAPPRGAYETDGKITLTPEGELRRILYEFGIPKPTTRFSGAGEVAPPPVSEARLGDSPPP